VASPAEAKSAAAGVARQAMRIHSGLFRIWLR
jgi:hypothetical protein